jgi:hypothetical protein
VGITFSRLFASYWIDNLGFLLREKLAAIFIIPCSWGFPTGRAFLHHQLGPIKFFWRGCWGIEEEEAPTSNTRSPVNLAPAKHHPAAQTSKRRLSGEAP